MYIYDFNSDLSGDWFKIAILGCMSLLLVINNQVLNKIKIALLLLHV